MLKNYSGKSYPYLNVMDERMDGWMDRWEEWMDRREDGSMDGQTGGWMDRQEDGWIDG